MPKVTAKKKCCKDKPRCARCPVVLVRLEKLGHAERRRDKREFRIAKKIPKKAIALARQR